jgi:hypothetical protein
MKLSYALTAAATRGSAGAELLEVAGVVVELVVGAVGLPEVPDVLAVVLPAVPLGPGFGVLLLQPATTTAIAAATNTTLWDLTTGPPFQG